MSEAAHPEANIIFGAVIDDALGDEVRVTVIAAGFDGGQPPTRRESGLTSAKRDDQPSYRSSAPEPEPIRSSGGLGTVPAREESSSPEPAPAVNEKPMTVSPPHVPPARPYQDTQAEELDVPDFLK